MVKWRSKSDMWPLTCTCDCISIGIRQDSPTCSFDELLKTFVRDMCCVPSQAQILLHFRTEIHLSRSGRRPHMTSGESFPFFWFWPMTWQRLILASGTCGNMAWTTFLFVLFSTLLTASALYFHIGETEKKCFIEEIPDETMVVGKSLI